MYSGDSKATVTSVYNSPQLQRRASSNPNLIANHASIRSPGAMHVQSVRSSVASLQEQKTDRQAKCNSHAQQMTDGVHLVPPRPNSAANRHNDPNIARIIDPLMKSQIQAHLLKNEIKKPAMSVAALADKKTRRGQYYFQLMNIHWFEKILEIVYTIILIYI